LLRAQADVSAYLELLPYILDPHGPGSRLSVRRDPSTRTARSQKRADGVFYTPADVAEYMASACLDSLDAALPPPVFDPACGTGVFLRAAFSELRRRFPGTDALSLASACLFGADIEPWAPDASTFVLLVDIAIDPARMSLPPVAAWQRMRRNFACIDTLRIDAAVQAPSDSKRHRDGGGRIPISHLFPALKNGPAFVLGNPPYADLGARSDLAEIGSTFGTIAVKQQPGAEIYLAFIEQMIRLAAPEACAGALVLPLSIACNVGPQFAATRKLIGETRGRWRFAFFDREPRALFGEDVKTRNAIVLWSRAPRDKNTVLATGPLRKWRGNSRAQMFKSLSFTAIGGDIRGGIPKIDGARQAAALDALVTRWSRLERAVQGIGRRPLATAPNADELTVFVGPTAYNFLNVFLRPPRTLLQKNATLSEHPLHAITCASRHDALAVFAVLSSHLAYWWWHAHGDGFHVSGRFLSEFPFGLDALSGPPGEAVSRRGEELWSTIRTSPIISLNRGRTSLAFTPHGHDGIRRKIDQILADLAGLRTTLRNAFAF
jgi:N-6 DNA Methylase